MTTTVIDPIVFEQLVASMGADFMDELIDAYLDDTPELIRAMQTALESGDLDTFRRSAHSIKSTSASFGATELAEAARELERMVREADPETLALRLAQLSEMFARAGKELQERKHA